MDEFRRPGEYLGRRVLSYSLPSFAFAVSAPIDTWLDGLVLAEGVRFGEWTLVEISSWVDRR